MTDEPTALVLDLIAWLAPKPRTYAEAMDAWRTSCPRLTVWEDAVDAGFIVRRGAAGGPPRVEATALGLTTLRQHRPAMA